jgi:hypothetical protein
MKALRWVVGSTVLLSSAIACSFVVDLDPLKGSAAAACGSASTCRPPVPAGWQGPVFLREGNEGVGCVAPFGSKVLGTILDGVDAGPAACTCACATNPKSCLYRTDIYSTPNCAGSLAASNFPAVNGCLPSGAVFSIRWLDAGTPLDAGGCTAAPIATTSTPTSTESHLCLGAFPTSGCTSGVCMPSASKSCIATEGDLPCPAPFSTRRIFERKLADGRTCSGCSCAFDPNACKAIPTLRITKDVCAADAGTATTFANVGGCTSGTAEAGAGAFTDLPVNGCTVSAPSTPTGTVTASDPVTVCCVP